MPVGLDRKWILVATLAAALASSACKDEGDEDPVNPGVDSGRPDSGVDSGVVADTGTPLEDTGTPTDAAKADTGTDTGTPVVCTKPAVMCGTASCTCHKTALTEADPGCATSFEDASVCGISTSTLGGADAGLPPFLERDAPGAASPTCAAFVDALEPVPDGGVVDGGAAGNGRIDTPPRMISGLTIGLSYEGCCTKAGFCSGNTGKGKASIAGMAPVDSNAGYGCLNPRIFFSTTPALNAIKCDPMTGVRTPASDGGTDGGGSDGGGSDGGGDAGPGDAGDGGNS